MQYKSALSGREVDSEITDIEINRALVRNRANGVLLEVTGFE